MWLGGSPLPRIVVGAQRFVPPQAPMGVFLSPFHVAARSETPSGISPVVAMRQSAISSLRASATIIVLRVAPRASAVRARYHCASARVPDRTRRVVEVHQLAGEIQIYDAGRLVAVHMG